MDEVKDLEYLFNKVGLYSKETFKLCKLQQGGSYSLDKQEYKRLAVYLGAGRNKIETRCTICKKDYPFDYSINRTTKIELGNIGHLIILGKQSNGMGSWDFGIDLSSGVYGYRDTFEVYDINEKVEYVQYDFHCTNHDRNHYQMMVRIKLEKGMVIVQKIGQYPSTLDIFGDDFKEYEKTLEDFDAYSDYRKSYICYGEGYYVGAFVYLRRVLEKIVDDYTKGLTLKDNHFSTKMDACKDRFDIEIQDALTNLYGVLSTGVHSLSEDECKEYYQCVKAIIEIQLEHIKNEKERLNKIDKNKSTLSSIASVIAKKK